MTVPKLALSDNTGEALAKTRADVVVIGTLAGEDGPLLADGAAAVDAAFDGRLAGLLATLGASGKAEEVVKIPTLGKLAAGVVLAVGLGKAGDAVTPEQVRRAAGAAGRALAGTDRAFVTLSELDLQAAVEGTSSARTSSPRTARRRVTRRSRRSTSRARPTAPPASTRRR